MKLFLIFLFLSLFAIVFAERGNFAQIGKQIPICDTNHYISIEANGDYKSYSLVEERDNRQVLFTGIFFDNENKTAYSFKKYKTAKGIWEN